MADSSSTTSKALALALIIACVIWIIWEIRGQKRHDAATQRCFNARDEYACRACCGDGLVSRWYGGVSTKGKCACYVQSK